MQNILVPTDLSIRSLHVVSRLAQQMPLDKANITLLHMLDMPGSIQDLLFIRRTRQQDQQMVSRHFTEACEVLRNKHQSAIGKMHLHFLYGSSRRVFNHFLQSSAIDLIAYTDTCNYKSVSKRSIDVLPFIVKSNVPHRKFAAPVSATHKDIIISALLPAEERVVEPVI